MPQGMVTPKTILDSNLTVCIMVAKLLCCASSLKRDDVRMKDKVCTVRWCKRCDFAEEESAKHGIMQRPERRNV